MRANEILLLLKNKGHERGLQEVVLQLSEEINDMRRTQKEIGVAFAALVETQTLLNQALGNMDEKIRANERPEDGMGSTRGLLEKD